MTTRRTSTNQLNASTRKLTAGFGAPARWSPERRRKWRQTAQWVAIGLMALLMIVLQVSLIGAKEARRERLFPDAMRRLEALANLIATHDQLNADFILEGDELREVKDWQSYDTDRDGRIELEDAKDAFAMLSTSIFPVSPRLQNWLEKGGNASAFDLLDRNRDGFVTDVDYFLDVVRPDTTALSHVTDTRTGREILVDDLRARWLREILERHERGQIRYGGKDLPRASFMNSQFGTLRDAEGAVLRGFLTYSPDRRLVHVLLADASRQTRQRDTCTITLEPNAPEAQWLVRSQQIQPESSREWAELAMVLSDAPGLRDLAVDCARRALIYDVTISELHGLAGVTLKDGVLTASGA